MTWIFPSFATLAAADILELIFGYPKPVYRRIGHPVEWMGSAIAWLDALLNKPGVSELEGRSRGVAALLVAILATLLVAVPIAFICRSFSMGWLVEALIATSFIAQRSLRDHVKAVIEGLDHSLERGRIAVSMIVGRDPKQLDESGISRAALESLAENSSDGVIAPVVWLALFGLPGIAFYKLVNTADSMIGHKSERYLHFGWAAARLDDLINLPCSRLCGLMFAMLSTRPRAALAIMLRDASKHQSPNAGWPEAALAGALGIRLGGPRSYDGAVIELATMGTGRGLLDRNDIRRGLRLYGTVMTMLALVTLFLAWLLSG